MQISIAVLCALFIATLWPSLWFRLSNERQRVIEAAQQQTGNIARLFEEHVLRTLAAAYVTLKQLESDYKRQGKSLDLARYLRDRQPELEPYTILSVVDEEGNLLLTNVPFSKPQNVRHLENTQFHMRNATQEVFISKPRLGVLTGRQTIFLTRRMNKADGSFGGNTGVGMNPQYFSRFYNQIDLGPDAVVLLVGRDGVIRTLGSSKDLEVGQDISRGPLFTTHLPQHDQGQFLATSPLDGILRLNSYRAVEGYPLVVLVGMSEAAALARFQQDKRVYLWWASGVSLVIVAFTAMVLFEIARRERANEKLRASEERFALAVRGANDGIWDWNLQTHEAYISPHWKEIVGYREDELPNLESALFDMIHPDDKPSANEAINRHLENGEPYRVELRLRHKDGSYRWIVTRGEAVRDENGRPMRMVGAITDITARKRAEEQIKNSLQEKETLLKEIHHRVKNNLQIISSLLYLQSSALGDPVARQALRESQDRVRSMGLVHEQLYRSSNFSAVDFGEHLKELTANIAGSYGAMNPRVRVETELESVAVDLDLAIPVSLIFNEILT
ncbi:MAG TPA: histidine kinase dimerization/phosphoacceptor domain -containing protein, partial [Candidatus Binatia bacterium]|nr:histidine kinase dimerization/phosphoacceptor domain -containing protein [Candidatus Binatia bacterium]